jgi:hypothetical protein
MPACIFASFIYSLLINLLRYTLTFLALYARRFRAEQYFPPPQPYSSLKMAMYGSASPTR